MERRYTDINEAVQREIIDPIEAGSLVLGKGAEAEYNIDALADALIEGWTDENGQYFLTLKEDVDFWEAVERAAYPLFEDADGNWHRADQQLMEPISFGDEISEVDGLLNFYIPITFDADAMFGTDVETFDNDDWLNVYANYDMARGEVTDRLELSLNRADGSIEYLTHPLSAEQCAALRQKMDSYCLAQTGKGLDAYVEEITGTARAEDALATGCDLDAEDRDARDASASLRECTPSAERNTEER